MDEGILGLPSLNEGSVQMDERISGLPSPDAGSLQIDERISGLPSPNAGSPKASDGEAILNASAAESIITSNGPVNAIPEAEKVSDMTSLEEKTD